MRERGRWLNGARGAFLLTMGALHVFVGLYVLALPPLTGGEGIHGPLPFLAALGVPTVAAVTAWWSTGLVAWIAAFLRRPGYDAAGFMALAGMEAAWGTVYAVGWVMGANARSGWFLVAVFWLLSASVVIVSKMVGASSVLSVDELCAPSAGAGPDDERRADEAR